MHWDRDQGIGVNKFRTRGALDVKGEVYQDDALVKSEGNSGSAVNLIPNGTGGALRPAGWSTGLTASLTDKPDEVSAAFFSAPGQGTLATTPMFWEVDPSAYYLAEVWMKADKPNSMLYIEFRDQDGVSASRHVSVPGLPFAGAGGYPVGAHIVPTTWTKYTSMMTIAGTTASRLRVGSIYFNHPNGTERTATIGLAIRLRPLSGGVLSPPSLPYAVAAGSENVSSIGAINAGGAAYYTVSLPAGRFTQAPIVVANSLLTYLYCTVDAITTTSFRVRIHNTNPGSITPSYLLWQAVQMTPNSGGG